MKKAKESKAGYVSERGRNLHQYVIENECRKKNHLDQNKYLVMHEHD